MRIHDLHHVVTGYQTDLRGEAEIGAWELASGCLRWPAATILNLFALAMGLVIAPHRMARAWSLGRHTQNLYARTVSTNCCRETSPRCAVRSVSPPSARARACATARGRRRRTTGARRDDEPADRRRAARALARVLRYISSVATQRDVRQIALALPGVTESATDFAFGVDVKGKSKGLLWSWKERVDPKKPRVPNRRVIAVRVANVEEKALLLLAADAEKFFTEPHYNGFPAVLVRFAAVTKADLRKLIAEAHGLFWRDVGVASAKERGQGELPSNGKQRAETMRRKGSCLCGALRYEVEGDFDGVWMCHCSNCRKASGGTGNTIVIVPRERFHWLSGEDHRVTYALRPTYSITRCKTCGTPLPAEEDEQNIYLTGRHARRSAGRGHQEPHLLRFESRLGTDADGARYFVERGCPDRGSEILSWSGGANCPRNGAIGSRDPQWSHRAATAMSESTPALVDVIRALTPGACSLLHAARAPAYRSHVRCGLR